MAFQRGVNRHHTLWPRADYRTKEQRAIRQHPSMIHRVDIQDHRDLHHEIQPLRPMSRALAITALQFLPRVSHMGRFESFTELLEHFEKHSRGVGKKAVEAGMFAEHLEEQSRYM